MAVREIITLEHSILHNVAHEVCDFDSNDLELLVRDMIDTMQFNGGLGLAAPQIGVELRIIVFGYECSARYPDADPVPLTVLINPKLKLVTTEQVVASEGCLSLPGARYDVSRYAEIQYSGYNLNGGEIIRSVCGYHARVVQHEYDHLDGVLIGNRVKLPRSLEAI